MIMVSQLLAGERNSVTRTNDERSFFSISILYTCCSPLLSIRTNGRVHTTRTIQMCARSLHLLYYLQQGQDFLRQFIVKVGIFRATHIVDEDQAGLLRLDVFNCHVQLEYDSLQSRLMVHGQWQMPISREECNRGARFISFRLESDWKDRLVEDVTDEELAATYQNCKLSRF